MQTSWLPTLAGHAVILSFSVMANNYFQLPLWVWVSIFVGSSLILLLTRIQNHLYKPAFEQQVVTQQTVELEKVRAESRSDTLDSLVLFGSLVVLLLFIFGFLFLIYLAGSSS